MKLKGMTPDVCWWGQPSGTEPSCPLHLPLSTVLEPCPVGGLLRENSIWQQNKNKFKTLDQVVELYILSVLCTFCLALKTATSRQ